MILISCQNTCRLLLATAAIQLLLGCNLFFPKDEPEVTLKITAGTGTVAGVVTITNHTDQTIYVPYIQHPFCVFFIFELEHLLGDSQIDSLRYYNIGIQAEVGWYRRGEEGWRIAICAMSLSHVQIKPSQSFEQDIPGARLETGDYRITSYYGYGADAHFGSRPWNHFSGSASADEWTTLTERFSLD